MRGNKYAGAATCITCHKKLYDTYVHTAHSNSSRPATAQTITGSFMPPGNQFIYNDSLKVVMEKTDSGFYQTAYINGKIQDRQRFDITIGSSRKAQTYLYYHGDEIHQLPISYFVPAASWAISPGFSSSEAFFNRIIPTNCFGCHASAANVAIVKTASLQLSEKYLPNQLLLGIDCERCHGPAKEHVDYQTSHPKDLSAKFITDINKLNRTQKTDMCANCHSGIKKLQQPLFTFKPGSNPDDYFFPEALHLQPDKLDVHGTQTQFLMASKCYLQSDHLTCTNCHDPHQTEKDNLAIFSQRCMTCHSEANHNFCKMAPQIGATIKNNCIDCHMPAKASKSITLLTNGKESAKPDYIRTHLIAVYNNETKRVLQYLKTSY